MARKSRIRGRSKLRKRLSKMPQSIKGPIQDAVLIAANMVYDEAQRNVPVDEGDLKKAMKIRHRGDKLGATIGYYKKGNKRNWELAGWRAHFTEFGTKGTRMVKNKNRFSLNRNFGRKKISQTVSPQKARPFLGPAYLKNQGRIKRTLGRAVNKGLRKASSGNFS